MRILITGASGFIGKHLVDSLAMDDSYSIDAISRSPLLNLNPKAKNHISDLSLSGFENALRVKIDTVVHLAQSNQYSNFPEGAEDVFSVNVRSTQTLLEWSRKNGVKKFIFASTGNVYKQQNKLLTENDICEPLGYYGASKYSAEQLVKPYSDFFQTTILRFFGVYGPGQKKMIIPNIINKVLTGKEIILAKGEGLNFTPLYIDDCIEMLKSVISGSKTGDELYNISGTEVVHLGKLVEMIAASTNMSPILKLTDMQPMYLMGDGTFFYRDFNYIPSINIKNGLYKTLKHGSN